MAPEVKKANTAVTYPYQPHQIVDTHKTHNGPPPVPTPTHQNPNQPTNQPTNLTTKMSWSTSASTSTSRTTSPIFHPRSTPQRIIISPGHANPGFITYIATLLPPRTTENAAFQNPANDQILSNLLTSPRLLKPCKTFKRELPANQNWTAQDEERNDNGTFGRNNLEREWEVDELLEKLKQAGVDVKEFDRRSTWSLRAVEVNGPFEIRVDEKGHESVVEVPDRRRVFM